MEKINNLLELISKCNRSLNSDSESKYNIFEVMGVEYNEVIACRFIGNLLDPKGSHGLGDKPLRLFIEKVLRDGEGSKENLENAIINLEEHTDNDRRVDIVIHLNKKIYPIEVKIWAGDRDKQLKDYYRYFFGENGQGKIYYLTPEVREPSEKSKVDLQVGNQIGCISFSNDIIKWLEEIQKEIQVNSLDNIKFVIKNFVEVIKKMSEQSIELKSIIDALELDDDNGKYNTGEIKSTITLLKYRDEIWDKIRKNCLKKIISCDGYELEVCDGKEQKDEKLGISHILMKVFKNGKNIAWICAETNLYIVTEKRPNDCTADWTEYNNEYRWKYINNPKNPNQHIRLNAPNLELTELCENEISLKQYLAESE